MMAGVLTVLLAAAIALPFTPPAGWVQLPQAMVGARVSNVWKGPQTAGGMPQTFSAVVFPFPGTADMLAGAAVNPRGNHVAVTTLSNAAVNLCGTPGRLVTMRVQSGSGNVLQQEVAVKNGYGYMLMYSRPAGTPPNRRISAVMQTFCPSGTASIPTLDMPPGWRKSDTELQVVGAWMGTQPGQTLTLLRGTQMESMQRLFATAQSTSITGKAGKTTVKVVERKHLAMCGYPGMLVDMQVQTPELPLAVHIALTQGSGVAYVLAYTQMGTAPIDPAAMASLQTLCVSGAAVNHG